MPSQLVSFGCVERFTSRTRRPAAHRQLARFGGVEKFTCVEKPDCGPTSAAPAPGQGAPVNWPGFSVSTTLALQPQGPPRELAGPRRTETRATRVATPKSAAVDWRVARTARPGPLEARPSTAPLQAPGAAGALDGEVLTNKSSQGRADAQRLVATRLLDRVHDPLGHFSRLQRIYPRAR